MPSDEGDLRVSDAEREASVMRLRDAAGEGRLNLEELADRVEAADAAGTRGELDAVVADLPPPDTAMTRAGAGPMARRRLYGIVGGDTLSGPFELSGELRVINVMGGADLDLTQAVLPEGEATVRIFSLMGGSNITVPHGVRVEHSGFGFLGWDKVEQPARGRRRHPPARRWCGSTRSASWAGPT